MRPKWTTDLCECGLLVICKRLILTGAEKLGMILKEQCHLEIGTICLKVYAIIRCVGKPLKDKLYQYVE